MFTYETVVTQSLDIKEVLIHFPEQYRVSPIRVPYTNVDLTARQCEINIMKFIHSQIKKYVNNREKAFIYTGSYTSQRRLAIDSINFRLSQCEEGRLLKLARCIANVEMSLSKIRPSTRSMQYNYYLGKIKPLIDWCITVAERHHEKKREAL